MLYPISIQTFDKIRERDYVYVDKTDLVYELAQENVCFLSNNKQNTPTSIGGEMNAYITKFTEAIAIL